MQYRRLGGTDMNVSTICFGCWQVGEPGPYGYDDDASRQAIHHALDRGINFFDTAEWYGGGHSERVLAGALGRRRADVYIATKVGLHREDGRGVRDSRPRRIRQTVDGSLSRLKTDYIDLLQIHWPDPLVPLEHTWEAMLAQVKAGKVRYVGVSNFGVKELRRCLAVGPVHASQPCYHVFRRSIEAEHLPFCRQHGVGVMPYGPLAHGLLTGKYAQGRPLALPPDDWRREMPIFQPPYLDLCLEAVEHLKNLAADLDLTLPALAVAWALHREGITTVITGSRTSAHLDGQLAGADAALSDAVMARIDAILTDVPGWYVMGGSDAIGGNELRI